MHEGVGGRPSLTVGRTGSARRRRPSTPGLRSDANRAAACHHREPATIYGRLQDGGASVETGDFVVRRITICSFVLFALFVAGCGGDDDDSAVSDKPDTETVDTMDDGGSAPSRMFNTAAKG